MNGTTTTLIKECHRLANLGMDGIAKDLEQKGVKGIRKDRDNCPLVHRLKDLLREGCGFDGTL